MSLRSCPLPALLLAAPLALAGPTGSEEGRWHGNLDLGYTAIAGNSNATTLLASTRASRTDGRWTHNLEARGKSSEENGVRTAEAYRLAGKEDIAWSARDYLYVSASWDKDHFSGYDWQGTLSAGYGRKLIDGERHRLSVEIGPGFRHDELAAGGDEQAATARAGANYQWQATANTRLLQTLEVDAGEDSAISRSLSELAVKLNSRLALKATLELRRDSEPPAGSKNTDRTSALAIAWSF
jgi:putative salt-induced outer membrane protein